MKRKGLSSGKPSKRQVDELFWTLYNAREELKRSELSLFGTDDSDEANGRARQTQG